MPCSHGEGLQRRTSPPPPLPSPPHPTYPLAAHLATMAAVAAAAMVHRPPLTGDRLRLAAASGTPRPALSRRPPDPGRAGVNAGGWAGGAPGGGGAACEGPKENDSDGERMTRMARE